MAHAAVGPLTGTKGNDAQPAKPQSTNILAPGAQVDPRDAWRGQADAQLKAIEQRSRDLAQRNAELEGQGGNAGALKKLEGSGPHAAAASARHRPAARPQFRAGSPRERARTPVRSASRRHRHRCRKARCRAPVLPPPPGNVPSAPTPTGIVSIALGTS